MPSQRGSLPADEDKILDNVDADNDTMFFADHPAAVAFDWNWGAGAWAENEIIQTDVALGQMADRVGNTKLLGRSNGASLTYYRWGALGTKVTDDADKWAFIDRTVDLVR